jgi:dGTPase
VTAFARTHADPLADGLPPLMVDRQRIVHSASFRRLEHKTQVFVALEGDHYRTRLTHTLEVAHLARLLAASLGLNADLAEAAALAHDLGHPPFGHAGERALSDAAVAAGLPEGFEHNAHSLRVVEELEHPYPMFHGLNLTREVRECLAKHSTGFDNPAPHELHDGRAAPPEGRIAALADRLAYGLHDLQDGLYAGLIDPTDLSDLAFWREAYEGPPPGESPRWRSHLRPTVDRIQRRLLEDVSRGGTARIGLSPASDARLVELERFLLKAVYRHHRLVRMDAKARRILTAVFEAYVAEPRLMPRRYSERVAAQGAARVAVDYVAGMTDRFCLEEHARLFDPRVTA